MNIDFSPVVIKEMQAKYQDKLGMQYKQMDLRQLEFPDGIFHVVVDKATLDSLLCAEGGIPYATKCLGEVCRVLAPNGLFVCVSHGHPTFRLPVLEKPEFGWTVTTKSVPKPMLGMAISPASDDKDNCHYIYICQKNNKC